MNPDSSNQQLLFAVLAVQLGFARPNQVMSAAASWMADRSVGLADRLEKNGVLSAERRRTLQAMVDAAVAVQGGDAHRSLADFGGEEIVRETFSGSLVLEPSGQVRMVADEQIPAPVVEEKGSRKTDTLTEDSPEHITPECAGRYRVGEEQGRGGQARVFLAHDQHIGRDVALKELLQDREKGCPQSRPATATYPAVARFLREARITGQLEHPNIIPVYEVGLRQDGRYYYTMRLVRGQNLADSLAKCRMLGERMRLLPHFVDVCNAVAYAHSRGVVHRDIKPENVMLGEFGEAVLLDWGLAKVKGKEDIRGREIERGVQKLHEQKVGRTLDGTALGTPSYMSPEQAEGLIEEIDERSDVWGLGAVLYQVLTGHPPFDGVTPYEIVGKVMKESVRPVKEVCAEAPGELATVAEKALRRAKQERYQSAKELAGDIEAYMTGGRVQAHEYSSWELLRRFAAKNKVVMLAATLVFAVVVIALVLLLISYRREAEARTQEREQRLSASYHLAQAYSAQADRLVKEKKLLSGRIYAAAALDSNPAHPASRMHDASFAQGVPLLENLGVAAASNLFRTRFRPVRGLMRTFSVGRQIFQATYSPDGRLLAAGDAAGRVWVWEAESGAEVMRLQGHSGEAHDLVFSADSGRLISGAKDQSVVIWDLKTRRPVVELRNLGSIVWGIALSPDGGLLAAGLESGEIRIWEALTGRAVRVLGPHGAPVRNVAFSPDGRLLAAASWDKTVGLWEVASGRKVGSLEDATDTVYDVAFSPDGTQIAASAADRNVRVWEVASRRLLFTLIGHKDVVYVVAYTPDGLQLASGGLEGTVNVWSATDGELLLAFKAHDGIADSVAFSPDGRRLATSGDDGTVRIWDRSTEELLRLRHSNWVYGLDFSSDGKWIATGTWDRVVTLWESNGRKVRELRGHPDAIWSVVFSPDDQTLATGGNNGTVWLWDVATGERRLDLKGHKGEVYSVDFSPDGTRLVTASADRTVRLWDVKTGVQLGLVGEHRDEVWRAVFLPGGGSLLCACSDGFVYHWDVASGRMLSRFKGHSDKVSGLVITRDARTAITTGRDRAIIVWDIAGASEVRRLVGHKQWVNRVNLSPDELLIATASDDGSAKIWDLGSGKLLLNIETSGLVMQALFSPDGRTLAVTDRENLILLPLDFSLLRADPVVLRQEAEKLAGLQLSGFELLVKQASAGYTGQQTVGLPDTPKQ